MLKRLAAVLVAGLFVHLAPAAQAAPQNISQTVGVCDPAYPQRCIKPNADGSIDVNGGGGGTSGGTATAASPTYVEGATDQALSLTLKGGLRTTLYDALGNAIDFTATSPVGGTATAAAPTYVEASTSNPVSLTLKGGLRIQPVDSDGDNATDQTNNAVRVSLVASSATVTTNVAAATTGGCSLSGTQSAASTNSTNVKNAAGTLCGGVAINTTSTIYYLRLYNSSSAPTCSSATGFVLTIPVPANASGAGTLINFGPFGADFATGISFCLTGGGSSTDNTNAATGVYINLAYK